MFILKSPINMISNAIGSMFIVKSPINMISNAIVYSGNDTKLVNMTKFRKEPIKVKRRLTRLKTEKIINR